MERETKPAPVITTALEAPITAPWPRQDIDATALPIVQRHVG